MLRNILNPFCVGGFRGFRGRSFKRSIWQWRNTRKGYTRFSLGQRLRAAHLAGGRDCRIHPVRIRHVAVGCSDVPRPRQSGQLVALSCRCSILSGLSDDLAAPALAFFSNAVHGDWPTNDLVRRRFLDWRHDTGDDAIHVASRRNPGLAEPLHPERGLRHSNRQRRPSVPAPPSHLFNQGVPCCPRHRLSRQRSAMPRRLRRSGWEPMVEGWLVGNDGHSLANRRRNHLAIHPDIRSNEKRTWSFFPQRNHGVHAHRPPRREIAC